MTSQVTLLLTCLDSSLLCNSKVKCIKGERFRRPGFKTPNRFVWFHTDLSKGVQAVFSRLLGKSALPQGLIDTLCLQNADLCCTNRQNDNRMFRPPLTRPRLTRPPFVGALLKESNSLCLEIWRPLAPRAWPSAKDVLCHHFQAQAHLRPRTKLRDRQSRQSFGWTHHANPLANKCRADKKLLADGRPSLSDNTYMYCMYFQCTLCVYIYIYMDEYLTIHTYIYIVYRYAICGRTHGCECLTNNAVVSLSQKEFELLVWNLDPTFKDAVGCCWYIGRLAIGFFNVFEMWKHMKNIGLVPLLGTTGSPGDIRCWSPPTQRLAIKASVRNRENQQIWGFHSVWKTSPPGKPGPVSFRKEGNWNSIRCTTSQKLMGIKRSWVAQILQQTLCSLSCPRIGFATLGKSLKLPGSWCVAVIPSLVFQGRIAQMP